MDDVEIGNYCACFIDLLGQRDALQGEGLLADFADEKLESEFRERVVTSIGTIIRLQENARHFLADFPELSIRETLNADQRIVYDDMNSSKMRQQRWSDGLVFYASMREKAPMQAIWDIVCTAGGLCLLGLAEHSPVRGGIDISWGAELHKNELYGPIVANSYELESNVAQYPRIVVSSRVANYFKSAVEHADLTDPIDSVNSQLALLASKMISIDIDGHYMVDYLGQSFVDTLFRDQDFSEVFEAAESFVTSQYQRFSQAKNTKLSIRYKWLLDYFQHSKLKHAEQKKEVKDNTNDA